MRVLHVIPSLSPRRGGPSIAVLEMVRAQRALGLDAEIATTDEDLMPFALENPTDHQGVPVRFFGRRLSHFSVLREFAFSPRFPRWLGHNIDRYEILHVHALFSHLPTAAMRTARRAGVPYLNRPLGILGRWPLRQSAWRKRAYLHLVEKSNLCGAAALHFVSESEQAEAADLQLAVRGVVVPHGIVLPPIVPDAASALRGQLGLAPDRQLVLFLGRVHAKKGIDLLLRALASLPKPRPAFLIAGDGPGRAGIERLARELALTSDVHWLGFIEGAMKNLCLQGADLFALTSHHENFGIAALEALAAGTPVLLSPQVALAAQVEQNSLGLVAPLQVEAIRDALTLALAAVSNDVDRVRRRSFVATNYSWAANAAALATLYREASQRSR
jgi:glycosyltransferase involved in cell wall biosynthesis